MRAQARSTPLPWVLLAVFLGGLCVFATVSAVSEQIAFSEYLSQARRCVELNDCPSVGGRTGGLPLFHGHSWIRLLSYSLRTGYDLRLVQDIVLALFILSIPTTFFFLQRYLGLRAATLALGIYFPVVLVLTDIRMLTYTNLLPLPFALYYAGIALFIESGRTRFGALASIALAAAVSAELGSIVMVPFHFALVAFAASRPIIAVVACAFSFGILFCLDSMDAALEIIRQIPTPRFAVALAICVGLVPLVIRLKPQLQVTTSTLASDRVRVVMAAALVYATATIWLGNVLLVGNAPAPRYFLTTSLPFLYLVAERLGALATRTTIALAALEVVALVLSPWAREGLVILQVPVAAIVTLYALATIVGTIRLRDVRLPQTPTLWPALAICLSMIGITAADTMLIAKRGGVQTLTLGEVEQLVPKLYSTGYTYPELLGSLQGPAVDDMMSLLTERDPQAFIDTAPSLRDTNYSLLVVKVPADAIPKTQGVIAAIPSDDSRSAIVVRGERSYLDWTRMQRCTWARDGIRPTAYKCAQPRRDRPVPHNWPYVDFGEPLPSEALHSHAGVEGWSVRFEVPVRTPGTGVPHIVRVPNEWPATWQIVRVTGVEFEGMVPGVEIRLPDTHEGAGIVELEFRGVVPTDLPWVWLPHVIEVAQDNEHLLEPFRRGRSADG